MLRFFRNGRNPQTSIWQAPLMVLCFCEKYQKSPENCENCINSIASFFSKGIGFVGIPPDPRSVRGAISTTSTAISHQHDWIKRTDTVCRLMLTTCKGEWSLFEPVYHSGQLFCETVTLLPNYDYSANEAASINPSSGCDRVEEILW